MDFRNRGMPHTPSTPGSASASSLSKFPKAGLARMLEKGPVALLFCIAIVITALTAMIILSGDGNARAVMKDKYQAVFLNNGQVYFGNIRGVNNRSINLQNIYYLQTNNGSAQGAEAAAANTNVSLVKLGCELHGPYDRMIINAEQVLFWENLQESSQVVKAIGQYQKDNAKGQTCNTQSQNSTQQAPSATTPTTTPAPAPGSGSNTPAPTTGAPQTTTPPSTPSTSGGNSNR